MAETLMVNEIFLSIQGESTFAGWPCVFVRLTDCPLRCAWCDTAYAFAAGARLGLGEVMARVRALAEPFGAGGDQPRLPLVEVTGGEPLAQAVCLRLLEALVDEGYTVLLETSGALDIAPVDRRVHRIMDLKCPASGEAGRNRWENLRHLRSTDEIKFVIFSLEDYQWARQQFEQHRLAALCPVLFSPATPLEASQQDKSLKAIPPGHTPISRQRLAELMLADGLRIRFQLQLHKHIWPPEARGV